MSVRIMSLVWDNGPESQGELLVLLALADFADDGGSCYPSMRRIAEKARMKERSAQRIVRRLEDEGWLEIDTGGGRYGVNRYRIKPRPSVTPTESPPDPEDIKPRPKRHKTPTLDTPKPSRTINEPSIEVLRALETVLSPQAARDFEQHRKSIKKPLTERAAELIAGKLKDHPDPDAVVNESIANGWQGIFPEKGGSHGNRTRNADTEDPALRSIAAAATAF